MIRYALQCGEGHPFEAWFSGSEDYDRQAERGLVECPFCASRDVRKRIMAPAVRSRRSEEAAAVADPSNVRSMMMEAAARVRKHVEERFDYVGDAFAREARAIHEGESEERGIYGEATAEEVRALKEDGVPVSPLPLAAAPAPKARLN
jgi:hypothetical protein